MGFSQMSSREKTIAAILIGVILIALVGVGILAAYLFTAEKQSKAAPEITVIPTTPVVVAPTITLVGTPSLQEAVKTTPLPISAKPIMVAKQASPGAGLPVLLVNQTLHAGHRYRLEISTADGSSVVVQGSWSQGATSSGGQIATPIEFFEGKTPYQIKLASPVTDPVLWSLSVSAGVKEILSKPVVLVITLYDVTGAE
ncbi:MAG: hypothetical protein ACUVWZ_06440 [Anaerolineae bacterium]